MLAIGLSNPHDLSTMIGLVAGLACKFRSLIPHVVFKRPFLNISIVFMDAGNGANYALVPHVHPYANGIVSGTIGATGNFGGIIGAIIFRYNGTHYNKSIWILGILAITINIAGCWIRPIPKSQIGGR